MAQMVKNVPAMKKTWVQSLGQEDPLEDGMANPSSILAWRIPWTEEPGGYSSWGLMEPSANTGQDHTTPDLRPLAPLQLTGH